MAASLDQREGDRPASAPQPPHFFKIILPETLLQEKLKIPRKFVRKHGNTLLDSVLVEVPSGRVWQIDLTRYDNGEVWLDNGWKPFVEYDSLNPGHLVAFRYEGTSKFCVFIYDVGSSEMNYQPHNVRGEALNTPKTEQGDKDAISVENLDDFQTLPQKWKRINSATETNNVRVNTGFNVGARETGSYNLSQRNPSPLSQGQKMEKRKEKLTPMQQLEMVRMKSKLLEKLDELEDMDESTMTKEQLERHGRKIKRYEDVLADTSN